jgi:SnoaL-like domain
MTRPHPFRAAVEARDHAAMVDLLAPDVILNSPVTFQPFEGREAVAALLAALLEILEDFRYTDELEGEAAHGLVFRAHVGDRQLEGLDLLRHDEQGRIADFTVMVRPLSGLQAVREAVAQRLGLGAAVG